MSFSTCRPGWIAAANVGTSFVHFDGGHQAAPAVGHSIRSLDGVFEHL